MIRIVEDQKSIMDFQKQFKRVLKKACKEKINCTIGFHGASQQLKAYYSDTLDFWFAPRRDVETRYWNAFGLGKPTNKGSNSIVVEINFPIEGINRRIGGAFGLPEINKGKEEVLVLHRGKIGGGKIGVSKELFCNNYRDELIIATDGETESEFCFIGSIESKQFPQQVKNFISEINRIKSSTEQTPDFSKLLNFKFIDESFGTSKIKKDATVIIERTHGIVVNTLADILENRGYKVGNDRNRDLFIHKNRNIRTIFEIKTGSSTQDLYSSVGQLLIYSIPIKSPINLVLVFPEKVTAPVTRRLNELGIRIVYYSWKADKPHFRNLDSVLAEVN